MLLAHHNWYAQTQHEYLTSLLTVMRASNESVSKTATGSHNLNPLRGQKTDTRKFAAADACAGEAEQQYLVLFYHDHDFIFFLYF